MRGRAHAGIGVGRQQRSHFVNQRRVDQGFVALHVDDDVVTLQAQLGAGLGEAVAAAGVVFVRQQGLHAMLLAGLQDEFVVCRHDHALGLALLCALCHAHHHG